jgi:thiaminase/transcriptional activator TenA
LSSDRPDEPRRGPISRPSVAISDQLAEAASAPVRDEMLRAFMRAAQLEWMFWDSAWRLERWPI